MLPPSVKARKTKIIKKKMIVKTPSSVRAGKTIVV